MATFLNKRRSAVKMNKPTEILWDSFRRGIDLLLQDVELSKEEVKKADNLILKGAGIMTQRPGCDNYFLAGSGKVRELTPYYKKDGTKEILAITDMGRLVKKSGASYSIIAGASFPSGIRVASAQIYDNIFIASKSVELKKYNGSLLISYAGISKPSMLWATKSSGTSGVFTNSYRVSAESETGETLASDAITLANIPEYLTTVNFVTVAWTSVANAKGYTIYGRESGNETFLTRVPSNVTNWIDDGNVVESLFIFPPEADFTAGPKGKHVITYKEKLIVGNLEGNPSRILWSGGGPNVDKFHWSVGGGYVDINKDDGQEIEGLIENEDRVIIFKTRSIYQLTLGFNSSLGVVEPVIKKISDAIGCLCSRTVRQVENDIFFVGRRAGGGISLNSLGYEPNFTTVLRTTEISARIRPLLETVDQSRSDEMWAIYYANKYWLFYPVGATAMKCVAYDRERLAQLGPFDWPNNPAVGAIFYDNSGNEHWLYGDGDDGYTTEISSNYKTDKGQNFTWTLETRREQAGDPMRLKNLFSLFVHLRNVVGIVNVDIDIETKTGQSTTTKNFSITGQQALAGWGSFMFGNRKFGGSEQASSSEATNLTEVIKYLTLNKTGIRSYLVRITGTGSLCDILAVKAILTMQSPMNVPSAWRVS